MRVLIILAIILFTLLVCLTNSQTYSDITYDAGTSIDIQTGADVCATNIYINGAFSGGGTICSGALPVTISSFTSSVSKNDVILSWVTESELNNAGFDVERQKAQGEWQKAGFISGHGTINQQMQYSFADKKLPAAAYRYRLKQKDFNGNFEYFELAGNVIINKPKEFAISQNYPNPSNPKSKIDYEIPFDGKVTIKVYDILGRDAASVVDEFKEAGYYTGEFDGTNLSSGVYFYRIIADTKEGKFSKTNKLILVK
jgi:hypothetical protein